MRFSLALLCVTCVAVSTVGARPASVPPQLVSAQRLVVVTTPDWDAVGGSLQAFDRGSSGTWQAARELVPIVVGEHGMAWDAGLEAPPAPGPRKTEGDGRSPAGVFALGTAFGYFPPSEARWLSLRYTEVTSSLECVDDPASQFYSQLVDRRVVTPDWSSSEKMREVGPQYHWGVIVEYNTRPVVPRRGSCIFLHVAGADGRGTAGCTAMAEPALKALMAWLDPAAKPVLVQLPRAVYDQVRDAWSLPQLRAARPTR